MRPYYQEKEITIFHGDCREVLPALEGFDLLLTDPPYNIGYQYEGYTDAMPDSEYLVWQLHIMELCGQALNEGGQAFYLHYPEFAARMFWSVPEVCDLSPFKLITWIYNTHTGGKPLRKGTRLWCWWTKGAGQTFDESALAGTYRNPTDRRVAKLIESGRNPVDFDWWRYEQVKNVDLEKTEHPCQLPLEMVARLVRIGSREGQTILDPFCGSGTTLRAAKEMGRKAIGIEIEERYCEIAAERLRQEVLPLTA